MENTLTTAARSFALENGARCIIKAGVSYDTADSALRTMAEALLERVRGTGIDLLALHLDGDTLVASVDDSEAEEPLSPLAFHQVVRKLSYELLGQVWNGRLAPEPTAPVAAEMALVA